MAIGWISPSRWSRPWHAQRGTSFARAHRQVGSGVRFGAAVRFIAIDADHFLFFLFYSAGVLTATCGVYIDQVSLLLASALTRAWSAG